MRQGIIAFVLAALIAATFAGCLDASDSQTKGSDSKRLAGKQPATFVPQVVDKVLGHTGAGLPLDPSTLLSVLPDVSYVSVGKRGPEPSIGVTGNGMIFFQAIAGDTPGGSTDLVGPATLRSDDGGKTWKNVAKPPFTSPTTLDPFLWVDPETNRVFVDHLYLACSYLSISDDYGANWISNPVACGVPGNDHQKLTTGKYRSPLTATPVYKNAVYYGYNNVAPGSGASRVSVSLDGGLTWPINSQSIASGTCSGGLHGKLHTGPDGYLYVPKRDCNGTVVGISGDNGLTWSQYKMGLDVGSAQFRKNPELGVDAENNLYMVWPGGDNRLYLSVSRDHGKTWSAKSIPAAPAEITTATMPSIVAGTPGRVAYAYYGVYAGNGKNPECVGTEETWDLYVTWSLNALDENPTFVTTRANALDDPVQIGGISTNAGSPGADCKFRRNLLDFIDIAMDKQGRIYVATADGCISCGNQMESNGSMGMASVQQTGPSLLASVADFTDAPKGVMG